MTDEQIREMIKAASQTVNDAREIMRVLDHHTAELRGALVSFKEHHAWDVAIRQREIAVLAREDRATVREREIDEALKKLQVGT